MLPVRVLVRAAPFLLGAFAAALWLSRASSRRRALAPARAVPSLPQAEPIDIVTVVDDLLQAGR